MCNYKANTPASIIFSDWHEYPLITVDIKHSSFQPLKGTAAGQSVVYSVCEGPFFHFGLVNCSKLEFFLSFVAPFLHLSFQSQYTNMRTACRVFLFPSTVLNAKIQLSLFDCQNVKLNKTIKCIFESELAWLGDFTVNYLEGCHFVSEFLSNGNLTVGYHWMLVNWWLIYSMYYWWLNPL